MSCPRHNGNASCLYKLRLGEKCRHECFLHNSFHVSISLLRIMVEHQRCDAGPYLARFGPSQPLKSRWWSFARLALESPLPHTLVPDSDFAFLASVYVKEQWTQDPPKFLFGSCVWRMSQISWNGHTETKNVTIRILGAHERKWERTQHEDAESAHPLRRDR